MAIAGGDQLLTCPYFESLSLFRIIPITETPFVEMDLGILWQEGLSAQLSRTPPSITSSAPVILLDSS